jgi:protein-S-isoprenylcysteine O-methyltransferase Ste14
MNHNDAPAYGLWSLMIINSLVFMYLRLARREERDAIAEYEEEYVRYSSKTPAFFPRLSSSVAEGAGP